MLCQTLFNTVQYKYGSMCLQWAQNEVQIGLSAVSIMSERFGSVFLKSTFLGHGLVSYIPHLIVISCSYL